MLCLPCLGTGEFPRGRTCERCSGRGDLPDARLANPMCPYCVGKGRDPFERGKLCSICDGWGRLPERRDPEPVAIPAGGARAAVGATGPGNRVSSGGRGLALPTGVWVAPAVDLEKLLADLTGDVDLCEPRLAGDTLERLRLLARCDLIRVLTQEVDAEAYPHIREFTRELPRFLFRRYGGRVIADRYVLTPSEVVFLRPTGKDESSGLPSAIRVPATMAPEMVEDLRAGFNRMWSAGERLG